MEMVKLKNGSEEAMPIVATVMMSLRNLMEEDPIAVYELHQKAKNSDHKFFGNTGKKLENLALVGSDGKMHESIKNVVLSAIEGEGLDMSVGSPVARGANHQAQKGKGSDELQR